MLMSSVDRLARQILLATRRPWTAAAAAAAAASGGRLVSTTGDLRSRPSNDGETQEGAFQQTAFTERFSVQSNASDRGQLSSNQSSKGDAVRPQKWKSPMKQKPPRRQKRISASGRSNSPDIPTSSWVKITEIPPMSNLQDILMSVDSTMLVEKDIGIIDLDADQPQTLLALKGDQKWVQSAHVLLSYYGRPMGWRIRFQNRSIANAFIQHSFQSPFHVAWKPATIEEWTDTIPDDLEITDATIRVENVSKKVTKDHMRHLFRRYDLTTKGPSVTTWSADHHKMYLVHFEDASWARAAVRELQGVEVYGQHLRLAQYPQQIR